MKSIIHLYNKILPCSSNGLAFELQFLHCFPDINGIILTSAEATIVQLVHDVACRHGFGAAGAVGLTEEGQDGLFAVAGLHETLVVAGDLLALVMGGLGIKAVVEQIECLGVSSLVGQWELVQIDSPVVVYSQITSAALALADEVVFVGGGDK